MTKKIIWEAINKRGLRVNGTSFANDTIEVNNELIQQQLTPLKVKMRREINLFSIHKKITYENITEFFREIATLISAGIPLINALSILEKNIKNKKISTIILSIQQNIAGGKLLSEALKSHYNYFDATLCNLVHAGEQSGTLDIVLQHISQYREKAIVLQKNIKRALLYPLIVLSVTCMVATAMLIFVIPQFAQLFANVGAELPIFTKRIIQLASWLKIHGLLGLAILIMAVFFIKFFYQRYFIIRCKIDQWLLTLPIFGKVIKHTIFARCFHTLTLMLQAGLPLDQSLKLAAGIVSNSVYQISLLNVIKQLLAGQSLYISIKSTRLFTDRIIQMINIGEESGCLEDMLRKLSEYYTAQVNYFVDHLNQLLEPIIMIFLCLVVGSLVIAVYLPIFHLGAVI